MPQYKKILRKILKLKLTRDPLADLKHKLEILAVKVGIKPAFLLLSDPDPDLSLIELVAKCAGLYLKLTGRPPDYFSRKPNVEDSFLKISNDVRLTKMGAIWLYKDVQVEPKILASIAGKLNEGHVLGFPGCCIKWEEEMSLYGTEAVFQDIKEYITKNCLTPNDFGVKTKDQMYEILIDKLAHDELRFEREKAIGKSVGEQIRKTQERYPFVPHWACQFCLSGESKETERLNNLYEELAMNLDPKFARKIISMAEVETTKKEKNKFIH